jgi:cytochrome c oxidase subunit III
VSRAAVNVEHLPTHVNGSVAPLYWGICGLILGEITVFSSFVSSYFYLRLVVPDWPPAGVDPPALLLPSVNTAILVVSSYFVHRADQGIRKGDQRWLKLGLSIGFVLAILFLVLKYVEYSDVPYRWNSHAYASAMWTITGFHTAHVIALVLKTMVIGFLAFRGYFNADRNLGVQVNGLYWNFVVIIWLPLYFVLYFAPRLLS